MTQKTQVETVSLTEIDLLTKVVQLDLPTLDKLIKIASERRDGLKRTFLKVGAKVSFGRPNGKKHFGTIEKINISKAVVNVHNVFNEGEIKVGNFRKYIVPFSMLELQSN